MPDHPLWDNSSNAWLRAYSKWTARVALVGLAFAFAVGVALIPLPTHRGGAGAVWPLSKHFGHAHILADLEMGLAWIVVGLAALVALGWAVYGLFRRAEWAE